MRASVRALLSPRTAAIIAVHLFGAAADLASLTELATERGVPLVEDNAQSLGSLYKGKKVGSFGTASATSFYPSKNLGAYGDAGMILTDSEEIAERLTTLRNHGQTGRYVSIEPGWNSRLDELQAAVLRIKLRHLDNWIAARRAHAARYTKLLNSGGRRLSSGGAGELRAQLLPLYRSHSLSEGANRSERRNHVMQVPYRARNRM